MVQNMMIYFTNITQFLFDMEHLITIFYLSG